MTRKGFQELSEFFNISSDGKEVIWQFNTVDKGGTLTLSPRMLSRDGETAGTIVKHPKSHSKAGTPAWLKISLFGEILRANEVAYTLQTMEDIPFDSKVVHRDGDPLNNNIANLVVIKKV